MRFFKAFIAFILPLLLWSSCSNDLDLTTGYQSRMVIFGLLDPTDTAQYVRIERSFLGEGNAYEMAQQFDSLNYRGGLTVTLERISNGSVQQVIPLYLDSMVKRDTGIFAYPKQYLYKTTAPILQDGSTYRLKVLNGETGETVTASTPIVQTFTVENPQAIATYVNLADDNVGFTMRWTSAREGKLYQPVIRFRYDELLKFDPTQVKHKYIEWELLAQTAPDILGGHTMLARVGGDDFYRFLNANLHTDNSVDRKVAGIDVLFRVAGDDLNTYMEVEQSNLSAFSDDSHYSNVEGGIGLFSSRYTYTLSNFQLAPVALDSLISGQYTSHLNFVP